MQFQSDYQAPCLTILQLIWSNNVPRIVKKAKRIIIVICLMQKDNLFPRLFNQINTVLAQGWKSISEDNRELRKEPSLWDLIWRKEWVVQ